MSKIIYVIAGPNGVGKTLSTENLIPAGIRTVNGDLIHFELFGTHTSSLISSEAAKASSKELMKMLVMDGSSFSFETNLAKENEWKQLEKLQKLGYEVQVLFVSVNDKETLNKRITDRVKTGKGHFVDPVIVEHRYNEGLRLLNHNFHVPDKLILINNSVKIDCVLIAQKGKVVFRENILPIWVNNHLATRLIPGQGTETRNPIEMETIAQVKARLAEIAIKPIIKAESKQDELPLNETKKGLKK